MQIIFAFAIGYLISVVFNDMFKQAGGHIEFEELNEEGLRIELRKMEDQRNRAMRVIAVLLSLFWLASVVLAITQKTPSYGMKTEL